MGIRAKLLQLLNLNEAPPSAPVLETYDPEPDTKRIEDIRRAKDASKRVVRQVPTRHEAIRRPTGVVLGDMTGNQSWQRFERKGGHG